MFAPVRRLKTALLPTLGCPIRRIVIAYLYGNFFCQVKPKRGRGFTYRHYDGTVYRLFCIHPDFLADTDTATDQASFKTWLDLRYSSLLAVLEVR